MNPTLISKSNDIEESSLTLHNIHRPRWKKERFGGDLPQRHGDAEG